MDFALTSMNRMIGRARAALGLATRAILFAAALVLVPFSGAEARVTIDITGGTAEPLPIAITDFASDSGIGKQISDVVKADLQRSGLFAPIDSSAFIRGIALMSSPSESL